MQFRGIIIVSGLLQLFFLIIYREHKNSSSDQSTLKTNQFQLFIQRKNYFSTKEDLIFSLQMREIRNYIFMDRLEEDLYVLNRYKIDSDRKSF